MLFSVATAAGVLPAALWKEGAEKPGLHYGFRMRSAPALLIGAVVALTLVACVPEDEPVRPDPSPTAEPIFASDEEALAAAEEAFTAYLLILDTIYAEGGIDSERLLEVATEEVYLDEVPGFENYKAEGKRSTGETSFDTVTLQSADLTGFSVSDAVVIYACEDFSSTDVLNAEGTSIVSPDGRTRWPLTISFDINSESGGSLIVSSVEDWTGEDFCVAP